MGFLGLKARFLDSSAVAMAQTSRLPIAIIEERSKKIEADQDSIMKQAMKVYVELKAMSNEQ